MKLAGSSGAGQELKSRFAMPVLRFCSGAVLLLAGLYGALLCFFQTFALPEAETALIWSLPTMLMCGKVTHKNLIDNSPSLFLKLRENK